MKIADLQNGTVFEDLLCVIKSVQSGEKEFSLCLADADSSVRAVVSKKMYDYQTLNALKEHPIRIGGVVKPDVKEGFYIKVKSLIKDESSSFSEVQLHISNERMEAYISTLYKYAKAVANPSYRALIAAYFEKLEYMKVMPATHVRQGILLGGMLQSTAAVVEMAVQLGFYYIRNGNQVYSFNDKSQLDWDLLITAALLHLCGNITYFQHNPPFYKNFSSVEQGYSECRTEVIYTLLREKNITMERQDLCALLGVMSKCNEQQVGVQKCRKEAVILYSAYLAFQSLDAFDQEVYTILKEEHEQEKRGKAEGCMDEEEKEISFSEKLGCYISEKEMEMKRNILFDRKGE